MNKQYGPHVVNEIGRCQMCAAPINASNSGTGCPKNVLDMPGAQERRRHALLLAASVIAACSSVTDEDSGKQRDAYPEEAVIRAGAILRVIESREDNEIPR